MVERLYFTDSDEANALIATDPLALLIGFALDQQVTVQKAMDLEPIFRERPAIHRFPGAMATRVHALVRHVSERYDGDAARVWTGAATSAELKANLEALPGFGEMKVKSLGAVLANRFDVALARPLVPAHPTLGDVDSHEALAAYQAGKRAHKARMRAAAAAAG